MKKLLLLPLVQLLVAPAQAQSGPAKSAQIQLAERAWQAWQLGENGGHYRIFRGLLDTVNFRQFSHPFVGNKQAAGAYPALRDLMNSRTRAPNHLGFSRAEYFQNGAQVAVLFNSKGTAGPIVYDGPVAIVFEFRNQKIVGFREYLGLIDPAWFK